MTASAADLVVDLTDEVRRAWAERVVDTSDTTRTSETTLDDGTEVHIVTRVTGAVAVTVRRGDSYVTSEFDLVEPWLMMNCVDTMVLAIASDPA